MIGENNITLQLQISDEDGNIIAIEAERTASMQEIFDCELCMHLFLSLYT